MAANPKIVPQMELVLDKKTNEPKPGSLRQRVRNLLTDIFKGHREFLGWTPD